MPAPPQSLFSRSQGPVLPKNPDLVTLLRLQRAGMIEPYVLLSAADEGIAQDYPEYRAKNRDKLEQYLSTFIVPPAPQNP